MDADEFERRMAAADACFKRVGWLIAEAKEVFGWGLNHIELCTEALQSDLDAFDADMVLRAIGGVREPR